MRKIVIAIEGMHCVSCGMLIEGELEDVGGIYSADCNYQKGSCSLEVEDNFDAEIAVQVIHGINPSYRATLTQ
ncbi:MAG: Heavy-metal-associated domain protein [bacterium ADurb.Bin400]|nr:MAG: Heavy-metal-associated domain protein [bacterium ADurb.Bin400]